MQKALARLRYRTDQELYILTEKQLERTLGFAQLGQIEEATYGLGLAKRLIAVARLSHTQHAHLEDQVARIESALRLEEPCTAVA